jgi:GNAT superfamily N-acetyltransferase
MTDISTTLETRTGFRFSVRPAAEADAGALAAFFAEVSDEDRRFRFLSSAPGVTATQIHEFTHSDHHHHENFVAFALGGQEIVAVATLGADEALNVGEVAISILPAYKGRGISWTLLDHVAGHAKVWGVKKLQSIENRQNHAAIDLEREKGFVARELEGDPSLVLLERTL